MKSLQQLKVPTECCSVVDNDFAVVYQDDDTKFARVAWRHSGMNQLNAAFVDGHASAVKKTTELSVLSQSYTTHFWSYAAYKAYRTLHWNIQ